MSSLCQLAGDYRGDMPEGGLMFERKWDGFRCLYFTGRDGRARLWTRNGMPIEGVAHISRRLQEMERAAGCQMMFDGELVVDGTLAATKAYVEKGWRLGEEMGVLHLFDCLPFADWQRGGTDQALYERKAYLTRLLAESEPQGDGWTWEEGSRGREAPTSVVLIEDGWLFDAGHVLDEARRAWACGQEGLMLKVADAPYRRLRSPAWQKVKVANMHKWRLAA